MPSPSSTSDSIAYFTCIGLGLLTTAVQEPAQASAANYDSDAPRLSSHLNGVQFNGVQSSSLNLAAADDPVVSDPVAFRDLVVSDVAGGDDLPALTTLPTLEPPGDAVVLAAASLESPEPSRSVSFATDVELSAADFDTPLAFQPLTAEMTPSQLQPEPLQTPAPPAGAIASTANTSPRPAYQVITTPPLTPVIAIGSRVPEAATEQQPFAPADRFTYRPSALSHRSDWDGIEIIGQVSSVQTPVEIDAIVPPVAPAVAPITASESTSALAAPLATSPVNATVAQRPATSTTTSPATSTRAADLVDPNQALTEPIVKVQTAFLYQDDDLSARARLTAIYPITSYLLVGGSIDLTEGDAFVDSQLEGVNINELYVTVAPPALPNLRFTLGQIDLTSYFDRNSFAKDSVTHFFNPIFQTNPALATSGIGSRQGIVANWAVTDDVRLAVSGFSSDRSISDFELDSVAAELGVRFGNGIIRGTYVNSQDSGTDDGPADIFSLNRGGGEFGIREGDREEAFGLNAEYFIPDINLGLFARFGHYNNRDADFDASTVSGGINLLDVFMNRDRLGLAYGTNLSGGDDSGIDNSDALELFYDIPIRRNLRAGVTLQQRDDFSETVVGFRLRSDFNILP